MRQELTSYSGLELFRRSLRLLDVRIPLRAACTATGGDYGGGRLALLIRGPFYVGARAISTVLRRASYARRSGALSRGRPILGVFRAQTRKFSILLRCSP